MKFLKKNYTTKKVLLIAFVLMTVIPIVAASTLYYHTAYNTIVQNERQYEIQLVHNARGVLEDFTALYTQFGRIRYEVTSQMSMLNITRLDYRRYTVEDLQNIRIMENHLDSVRRTFTGISAIYIINTNDNVIMHSSDNFFCKDVLLGQDWALKEYTDLRWKVIPHYAYYNVAGHQIKVISFVSGLADMDMDGTFEFIIQINLEYSYVVDLFSQAIVSPTDTLLVVGDDGSFVSHIHYIDNPNRELIDQIIAKSDGIGGVHTHSNHNIKLVSQYSPYHGLAFYKIRWIDGGTSTALLIQQMLLIIVAAIVVAVVVSSAIASLVSRPLRALIHITDTMLTEDDRLHPIDLPSNNKDILSLSSSLNILIDRVNLLVHNLVQKERDRKNAEIRMLQSQINPHFLYNTLNSIKWIALMHKQMEVADATVSLVDLLEFCCKDSDELISAETELDFLNKYIHLQKLRYQDAVKVKFDIEPEVYGLYIPKFTLQPAVENAFIHGFNVLSKDPHIKISGAICGDCLQFRIEDNGIGFDSSAQKFMTGIGLDNINERINLAFGEGFGQEVNSVKGEGTTVRITLPIVTEASVGP